MNQKARLRDLENRLTDLHAEFKRIYAESYGSAVLTNQQAYDKIMDANAVYSTGLKEIRLETLSIIKELHHMQDAKSYQENLSRLNN